MSMVGGFSVSATLSRADTVLFRATSGEAVLLDLASEQYFALDGVGASFWAYVELGSSIGDAIDGLLDQYDVDCGVLTNDLGELVGQLCAAGLLVVTEQ
jgi:hypothetical protein